MLTPEPSTTKDTLWSYNFVLVFLAAGGFYLSHQLVLPVLPLYVKELGGGVLFAGFMNGAYLLFAMLINLQMPRLLAARDRSQYYSLACHFSRSARCFTRWRARSRLLFRSP